VVSRMSRRLLSGPLLMSGCGRYLLRRIRPNRRLPLQHSSRLVMRPHPALSGRNDSGRKRPHNLRPANAVPRRRI
jgi:hypothetical protein